MLGFLSVCDYCNVAKLVTNKTLVMLHGCIILTVIAPVWRFWPGVYEQWPIAKQRSVHDLSLGRSSVEFWGIKEVHFESDLQRGGLPFTWTGSTLSHLYQNKMMDDNPADKSWYNKWEHCLRYELMNMDISSPSFRHILEKKAFKIRWFLSGRCVRSGHFKNLGTKLAPEKKS